MSTCQIFHNNNSMWHDSVRSATSMNNDIKYIVLTEVIGEWDCMMCSLQLHVHDYFLFISLLFKQGSPFSIYCSTVVSRGPGNSMRYYNLPVGVDQVWHNRIACLWALRHTLLCLCTVLSCVVVVFVWVAGILWGTGVVHVVDVRNDSHATDLVTAVGQRGQQNRVPNKTMLLPHPPVL